MGRRRRWSPRAAPRRRRRRQRGGDALRRLADRDQTNIGELVRIAVEDMLRLRGEWDEAYRPVANEARLSRHMPALGPQS